MNLKKYSFLCNEVVSWGFIVSADGLKTDLGKVCATEEWPAPQSIKEIQNLLYFIGRLKNYTFIMNHITEFQDSF